jgi:hypothetical protein
MKEHKGQIQPDHGAAAKRTRFEGLSLHGAKVGASLLAFAAFVGPKLPPFQGE